MVGTPFAQCDEGGACTSRSDPGAYWRSSASAPIATYLHRVRGRMRFMRMRRLFSFALACAVVLSGASAGAVDAPARARTVVIGLDMSKSNPLVEDAAYAARVGQRTASELDALPLRSHVMLRTFGSYDTSANALKIDEVISTRAKPKAVAEGIGALISAVPELVAQGKLQAQGYTNVISFLENTSQLIDCDTTEVTIILLTDGFE